jgi:oxygen-dependent protoporphyrinogen oxidase
MKRIAIIGGGISGLTAAYELELARKRGADIDWHLYEASNRLGGIIETTRIPAPEGEFGEWILEGGPDGWVTEKPWARELAIELGLEPALIYSNDATRKTYILINNKLQPIPDRMRLMVPESLDALSALDGSPLLSSTAKRAYASEITRAAELKSQAPDHDESLASFVQRHFGDEVLNTLAAPLLSGVFGGDVHKLSVRAVMPQFVAMEREHGSLIAALQSKSKRSGVAQAPIFTSLRQGMQTLTESLTKHLPTDRLHLHTTVHEIALDEDELNLWIASTAEGHKPRVPAAGSLSAPHPVPTTPSDVLDSIILATSTDETRRLLFSVDPASSTLLPSSGSLASLLPQDASSAILVAFAWPSNLARTFAIPSGFGFLVPQGSANEPQLLACTFVDQKFPHRAPDGARVIRAFFGGSSADTLSTQSDDEIAETALTQLRSILGPIPEPSFRTVRRWPRSLPQYEVGHLDRIAELQRLVGQIQGVHLLGNSYRGVGIPDLIRDARATARAIANH